MEVVIATPGDPSVRRILRRCIGFRDGNCLQHGPTFLFSDFIELPAKTARKPLEADDFRIGVGVLPVEIDSVIVVLVDNAHYRFHITIFRVWFRRHGGKLLVPPPSDALSARFRRLRIKLGMPKLCAYTLRHSYLISMIGLAKRDPFGFMR
jgi:hypothetical protein